MRDLCNFAQCSQEIKVMTKERNATWANSAELRDRDQSRDGTHDATDMIVLQSHSITCHERKFLNIAADHDQLRSEASCSMSSDGTVFSYIINSSKSLRWLNAALN